MIKNEDGTIHINSEEITEYLQNKLGFDTGDIACDYTLYPGVKGGYIRMRVCMKGEKVFDNNPLSTVINSPLLSSLDSRGCISNHVLDVIKPYMYPPFEDRMDDPNFIRDLHEAGIYGQNLTELKQYRELNYNKITDAFYIYLRVAKIVKDMLGLDIEDWCVTQKAYESCCSFTIKPINDSEN